jgi:curli biogenesis system outer membrane secretion channel CsgG
MKRINFFFLALMFFLTSCSTESVVLKKGYDFNQIKRVAVLQFKDQTYTQSTGSMVSQLFVKYLLKSGYNVVERDELDALLREKHLQEANLINPETIRVLKLSGIDAIVTGTVTRSQAEQEYFASGYSQFTAAQVGLTCRMIDAGTGEILWAGADTYDAVNTQTAFDYLTASLVRDLITELNKASKR